MDTSHRRSIAAITAQAVMLGYFLVINWIKLSPWNNLDRSGDQTLSTLVGVVPGVTVIGVLLFGGRRARRIAAVWTWLWLLLQILQWWVPYLTGLHPLTQDGGLWYFEGGYDHTVHLLPTEDGRVVPDAQHQVLQTLSLVAAILVTRAARSSSSVVGVRRQPLQRESAH